VVQNRGVVQLVCAGNACGKERQKVKAASSHKASQISEVMRMSSFDKICDPQTGMTSSFSCIVTSKSHTHQLIHNALLTSQQQQVLYKQNSIHISFTSCITV